MRTFLPTAIALATALLAAEAPAQYATAGAHPGKAPPVSAHGAVAGLPAGTDDCAALHANAGSGDVLGVPFELCTATTGGTGQTEGICLFFGTTGIANDVWFDWTATVTGEARLATCGETTVDTKAAVWAHNGPSSCPVTIIACNDDACGLQTRVDWPIAAGTTYTVQLGTFPGAACGSGTFSVEQVVAGDPLPCGQYDDGSTENSLGLLAGGEIAWIHSFNCLPAITGVETAYGSLMFPGDVTNGAASRVAVYDDLRGTGNPTQPHALLEVVNTVVVNGSTDILNPIYFTTAHAASGDTSFVLATADQLAGQFPGPMDQDNPVPEAWVAGNTAGPGSMDLVNLNNNPVPPLQMQVIGFPAAWLLRAIDGSPAPIGTAVCFGDGSGTPCPCGNTGGSQQGCANSTGQGATLTVTGQSGMDIAFALAGAPPGTLSLLFQGSVLLDGGSGVPFGDGIRCCGGNIVCLGVMTTSAQGSASTDGSAGTAVNFTPPLFVACAGGVMPGETRCYQYWYRNVSGSPCGFGFNLSNGTSLTWTPDLVDGAGDCQPSSTSTGLCDEPGTPAQIQEPGPSSCPPAAPIGCGPCGVNPLMPIVQRGSGELQLVQTDLAWGGVSRPVAWERQYRSRSGEGGASGAGMAGSYDVKIEADGADLVLHDGQGRKDEYRLQPDGTWVAEEFQRVIRAVAGATGTIYVLEFEDGGRWELADLDGSPAAGKLTRSATRNGEEVTLQYDGSGRLVGLADALARTGTIQYGGNGRVSAVVDPFGRATTYEYYGPGDPDGPEGALKSVTGPPVTGTPNGNDFPLGKTTSYTYTSGFADERLNGDLLTVTDPKGQTFLRNEYAHTVAPSDPRYATHPASLHFDRIVRQFHGGPEDVTDFFYEEVVPDAGNLFATVKCIENDRVGNVTETWFDARNREVIRREYTGRAIPGQYTSSTVNRPTGKLRPSDPDFFETRTEYNDQSLPTRIVAPDGSETLFVYEIDLDPAAPVRSRGNLREVHRLPGPLGGTQPVISEYFEYDAGSGGCCGSNFVTLHVDGNGHETRHEYDGNGNRVRTIHAVAGVVEEFEHDAFGQLRAHVHPDNGSGHLRRDEYVYFDAGPHEGRLQSTVVDAGGLAFTTSYEYDEAGNVVRRVDPAGHDALYVYNQLDQLVREESPVVGPGGSLRYVRELFYDANDDLVRIERDNLDEDGNPLSPARLGTSYEYGILSELLRERMDLDATREIVTEHAYDANRQRILTRSPEAVAGGQPTNETATQYDERGLVFRVTQALSDAARSTTQYDYDARGNLAAVRAGLEGTPRVTLHEQDGYGRLRRVTDPMGNATLYTYDGAGNVLVERREGELLDLPGGSQNVRLAETSYAYDAMNRRVREDAAFFDGQTQAPIGDGLRTRLTEYTPSSLVKRTVDDHGHATEHAYDGAHRLLVTTDAKGNVRTRAYDARSYLISETELERSDTGQPDQAFVTTHEYDGLGRRTRTTDNLGQSWLSRYDSRGNRVLSVDGMGKERRYVYDGLDRLVATVIDLDGDGAQLGDPADVVVLRAYDDNSRLVGQTDDNGNTTSYVYDTLDRRVATRYADDTQDVASYDVHGDLIAALDANGTLVTRSYDALGRQTLVTVQPGPGVSSDTSFEAYAYDGLSRLVRAEDDDSLVTRLHDSLSNLALEAQNGASVQSTFDAEGNKLSCVYPGGRAVSCAFDELHRKKTVSDDQGFLASFDYFGPSRVERREHGNGTRLELDHDGLRRIVRTRHTRTQDGSVIDDRTYVWDAVGNKTQRKDVRPGGPGFTHDYTYDRADRLVHTRVKGPGGELVRETSYALDGVHNRVSVSERRTEAGLMGARPAPGLYFMSAALPEPADFQMNQYTATPFDRRQYDAASNLIRVAPPEGPVAEIVYDFRNRMVAYTRGALSATYRYDALGRRIEKSIDEGAGPIVTRFLYDGWQEIEEQDGLGLTQATWVYGLYIDEPLTMRRNGSDSYYHADDLYNVMALTDAAGLPAERYEYHDYGQPIDPQTLAPTASLSPTGNPLLFHGRRYEAELGWYDYRTRLLDPLAGRFTTRDTIGTWGDERSLGGSSVAFGSSPASVLDPSGRKILSLGILTLHELRRAHERICKPFRKSKRLKIFIGLADYGISGGIRGEAALATDRGYIPFVYAYSVKWRPTWSDPYNCQVTNASLPDDGFNWRAADFCGIPRGDTCVEEIFISGHGTAIQSERHKLAETKFCDKCEIYMAGCHTQGGAQTLADQTKCRVFGTNTSLTAGEWPEDKVWSEPASPQPDN